MEWYPLDSRDGLVANLFHHLWRKNSAGMSCPNISFPDTVIFRLNRPLVWYFTSRSGDLLRKNKAKVTPERIVRAFSKTSGKASCEVVAVFISCAPDPQQPQRSVTTFEYLRAKDMSAFMKRPHKPDGSILQQFVPPRGTHNTLIRADWSPQMLVLEQRENVARLADQGLDMYQRVVTFEGAAHNSISSAVDQHSTSLRLRQACESVAGHVAVTGSRQNRPQRMVMFFKIDRHNAVRFLFCSYCYIPHNDSSLVQRLRNSVPDGRTMRRRVVKASNLSVGVYRPLQASDLAAASADTPSAASAASAPVVMSSAQPPVAAASTPVRVPTRPPLDDMRVWSQSARMASSSSSTTTASPTATARLASAAADTAAEVPHFFFTVPSHVRGHHAQPYVSMTSASGFPMGHAPKPKHFQCRGCGSVAAGNERYLVAVRSVIRYYEAKARDEEVEERHRVAEFIRLHGRGRRPASASARVGGSGTGTTGVEEWNTFSSPYGFDRPASAQVSSSQARRRQGSRRSAEEETGTGDAEAGGQAGARSLADKLNRRLALDILGGSFSAASANDDDSRAQAMRDAGMSSIQPRRRPRAEHRGSGPPDSAATPSVLHGFVPRLLQPLVPGGSYERYQALKRDPAFQYRTIRVCEQCCNMFTARDRAILANTSKPHPVRDRDVPQAVAAALHGGVTGIGRGRLPFADEGKHVRAPAAARRRPQTAGAVAAATGDDIDVAAASFRAAVRDLRLSAAQRLARGDTGEQRPEAVRLHVQHTAASKYRLLDNVDAATPRSAFSGGSRRRRPQSSPSSMRSRGSKRGRRGHSRQSGQDVDQVMADVGAVMVESDDDGESSQSDDEHSRSRHRPRRSGRHSAPPGMRPKRQKPRPGSHDAARRDAAVQKRLHARARVAATARGSNGRRPSSAAPRLPGRRVHSRNSRNPAQPGRAVAPASETATTIGQAATTGRPPRRPKSSSGHRRFRGSAGGRRGRMLQVQRRRPQTAGRMRLLAQAQSPTSSDGHTQAASPRSLTRSASVEDSPSPRRARSSHTTDAASPASPVSASSVQSSPDQSRAASPAISPSTLPSQTASTASSSLLHLPDFDMPPERHFTFVDTLNTDDDLSQRHSHSNSVGSHAASPSPLPSPLRAGMPPLRVDTGSFTSHQPRPPSPSSLPSSPEDFHNASAAPAAARQPHPSAASTATRTSRGAGNGRRTSSGQRRYRRRPRRQRRRRRRRVRPTHSSDEGSVEGEEEQEDDAVEGQEEDSDRVAQPTELAPIDGGTGASVPEPSEEVEAAAAMAGTHESEQAPATDGTSSLEQAPVAEATLSEQAPVAEATSSSEQAPVAEATSSSEQAPATESLPPRPQTRRGPQDAPPAVPRLQLQQQQQLKRKHDQPPQSAQRDASQGQGDRPSTARARPRAPPQRGGLRRRRRPHSARPVLEDRRPTAAEDVARAMRVYGAPPVLPSRSRPQGSAVHANAGFFAANGADRGGVAGKRARTAQREAAIVKARRRAGWDSGFVFGERKRVAATQPAEAFVVWAKKHQQHQQQLVEQQRAAAGNRRRRRRKRADGQRVPLSTLHTATAEAGADEAALLLERTPSEVEQLRQRQRAYDKKRRAASMRGRPVPRAPLVAGSGSNPPSPVRMPAAMPKAGVRPQRPAGSRTVAVPADAIRPLRADYPGLGGVPDDGDGREGQASAPTDTHAAAGIHATEAQLAALEDLLASIQGPSGAAQGSAPVRPSRDHSRPHGTAPRRAAARGAPRGRHRTRAGTRRRRRRRTQRPTRPVDANGLQLLGALVQQLNDAAPSTHGNEGSDGQQPEAVDREQPAAAPTGEGPASAEGKLDATSEADGAMREEGSTVNGHASDKGVTATSASDAASPTGERGRNGSDAASPTAGEGGRTDSDAAAPTAGEGDDSDSGSPIGTPNEAASAQGREEEETADATSGRASAGVAGGEGAGSDSDSSMGSYDYPEDDMS